MKSEPPRKPISDLAIQVLINEGRRQREDRFKRAMSDSKKEREKRLVKFAVALRNVPRVTNVPHAER
jgi:hypothetical protein